MKSLLLAALVPLLIACDPIDTPVEPAIDTRAAAPADTRTAADADPATAAPSLQAVINGDWRDPENVLRDKYRHPLETLQFFGLQADQTVVEITPGGGWYAEILAPYLRADGEYVAAVVDPMAVPEGDGREYQRKNKTGLESMFTSLPAQYDGARVLTFDPADPVFGEPGSADLVVTFRNVHNWRTADQAQGYFDGFFDVLRPGGILGVTEHRAAGAVADDDTSGYVGQAQVIALAENAGFELVGKSEINANPRDTKDHPNGVWTLPPTNNHEPADDAKYQAIGESDRMTLRFKKPE